VPPRGLRPSGLILADKPPGPSSFRVVRAVRSRTGARTGHAGTLDPFASGLLLVLSGSATRLTPWLVGLDKRYITEIDLRRRTSTGDPEGETIAESDVPSEEELHARLALLRGTVELPIPAVSAVKVGGQRAYRLARRGVTLEMPMRQSRIDQLDVSAYTGEAVTLDLRVSSGTYIRSVADALGGHCRTLRRTEVGPFRVEDADLERILPPAQALPFLPMREVDAATAAAIRQGRERVTEDVRVVHEGELVAVDGTVLP
jgi:tRNA pseudouridine55 synthase